MNGLQWYYGLSKSKDQYITLILVCLWLLKEVLYTKIRHSSARKPNQFLHLHLTTATRLLTWQLITVMISNHVIKQSIYRSHTETYGEDEFHFCYVHNYHVHYIKKTVTSEKIRHFGFFFFIIIQIQCCICGNWVHSVCEGIAGKSYPH